MFFVLGIINLQRSVDRIKINAQIPGIPTSVRTVEETDSLHFSIAVLKHSNATPFDRRRDKSFRCFFNCCENFLSSALRAHTRSKHIVHLFRAVKGVSKTTLRIDIADLRCTICDSPIPDLELLERHLKEIHDISTYKNTADVLVPYKLTDEEYQCQLCGGEYQDFLAIDAHMESHFPLNICEVCGRGFMSVRRLKMHSLEHAEKTFVCEVCGAPFVSEYMKRRHEDYIHRGIGFLICPICPGVRFKNHAHKLDHMEQVHNQTKRPTPTCKHCGKVYKHKSSLTVHMKSVHEGIRVRNCSLCTERFLLRSDLELHVRKVHEGNRMTCVYCELEYRCLEHLSRHMKKKHEGNLRSQRNLDFSTRPGTAISKHLSIAVVMHSNVTPFACRRGRKFRCIFDCCQDVEFSALRDHTRSKHATHLIHAVRGEPKTMLRVDITDLRCTICDHPIPDLELLESHLKDAHDLSTYKNTADVLVPYKLTEGVYRCQLCGEVSDNFPAIDTHMESHFPLNICEVCGRGFMSVSRLKTHSLEHAEKPFACETCQVTFVSESLKRRHVNYIHKGIGALICHMCPGLRFKDHKLKLDHMEQAHGREKRPTPTCSDCGKVFSYESSLTAHIKNIHQALKLNKCKLCDERFCIKKDLEKHVRLVHVAERLPCVYCDRSYTTVMELSKHMRKIHPDLERRCLCWDCGKPFENRLKLKQHRSNEHSSL